MAVCLGAACHNQVTGREIEFALVMVRDFAGASAQIAALSHHSSGPGHNM